MINCKINLNLRLKKQCVFALTVNNNTNGNADKIIFTMKDTKLYVTGVTLSRKDNRKLIKRLKKVFKRSVYWNKYKAKKREEKYCRWS